MSRLSVARRARRLRNRHQRAPEGRNGGRCAVGTAAVALLCAALLACGELPRHDPAQPRAQRGEPPPRALLGAPAGRYAGKAPRALVILLRGGGWLGLDARQSARLAPIAGTLHQLGFATLIVDYRRGAQGLDDVVSFYDRARIRTGGNVPICAFGLSAGGHLALMLAARRPSLVCVVALAAPTNLVALSDDPRYRHSREIAVRAFGVQRLAAMSPALRAGSIRAGVLLVNAANDPLVPASQTFAMTQAKPEARTIMLPPGDTLFVHSRVDAQSAARASREEMAFIAAITATRDPRVRGGLRSASATRP